MDDTTQQNVHGANRVVEHPVLVPLVESETISLSFDGVDVGARAGEPIAAALLAAGFRVFRTMPETGEPRGGYCMVGRCSDCLVVADGLPSVRACVTPVREGMIVQTQHGIGMIGSDIPADDAE